MTGWETTGEEAGLAGATVGTGPATGVAPGWVGVPPAADVDAGAAACGAPAGRDGRLFTEDGTNSARSVAERATAGASPSGSAWALARVDADAAGDVFCAVDVGAGWLLMDGPLAGGGVIGRPGVQGAKLFPLV